MDATSFSSGVVGPGGSFRGSRKKPGARVMMLHPSDLPPPARTPTLIKAFTINKVFEDVSRGIVCYKDANGEIICEGYDEGPRLSSNRQAVDNTDPGEIEEVCLGRARPKSVKAENGEKINHSMDRLQISEEF